MRTIDQLVQQEIIYCVSSLVSTLAGGYGLSHFQNGGNRAAPGASQQYAALDDLSEQAMELCSPVQDWESAAIEAGWSKDHWGHWVENGNEDQDSYASARDCCDGLNIEPHDREIFEHWIITDWLADQLEAKGERVAKDVGGMTIWGRTTTGQGIAQDAVIAEIYADLMKGE